MEVGSSRNKVRKNRSRARWSLKGRCPGDLVRFKEVRFDKRMVMLRSADLSSVQMFRL